MAFGLVFGLVSAARLDGKSGRQRASSAHPFENRKRMRHPLLRYRKQENQEAVKAAPPVTLTVLVVAQDNLGFHFGGFIEN